MRHLHRRVSRGWARMLRPTLCTIIETTRRVSRGWARMLRPMPHPNAEDYASREPWLGTDAQTGGVL